MRITGRNLINSVATLTLVLVAAVLIWKVGRLVLSGNERPDDLVFISARGLKEALDQGQTIVVLDVRRRSDYAAGHIPGAKNIPYDELETRAPNELDQNERVVTYCRCQGDTRSDMARQQLNALGFRSAVFLKGGIQNWEDQQYPTSR